MATHSLSFYSLAADKVTSCDDLLTEILLRLPVRSLFQFKSISRHWYSLITNPTIKRLKYPDPDPPSGLFLPIFTPDPGYFFVPFNVDNPVKSPFITLDIDQSARRIDITQTCNGLMLCSSLMLCSKRTRLITDKHYVYNPTINQITTLDGPGIHDGLSHICMNLAFDPSKSPHYKIIYVYLVCGSYQINMYSSQTRTRKLLYEENLSRFSKIMFNTGVYWNNAIHWTDDSGYIVYFNLDQEMLYEKQTPFAPLGLVLDDRTNYIFESRDHFLLVEISCPLISKFKIYELKRDYSEWFVKYHVDLVECGGLLSDMFNAQYGVRVLEFDVLSLILGEKEDDSFLVVEIPGKVIRLNLESKTYHKLHDFTSPRTSPYSPEFYRWPYTYQFMSLSTAFDV